MNAFVGQTFPMNQIVNIKEVVQFTSISRAKIYEMINPAFDANNQFLKLMMMWIIGLRLNIFCLSIVYFINFE